MYDPYSEPDYNPGGGNVPQQPSGIQIPNINFDASGLSAPQIDIKKYIPILAIGVVLIIIIFIAIMYLGSQKQVTFDLTYPDGSIAEGMLKVYEKDGKTRINLTPKTSSSSFSGTLAVGTYKGTITGDGIKTNNNIVIDITSDTTTVPIRVKKDYDATLSVQLDGSPTKIYEGQSIHGTITIDNKGIPFKASEIIANSSKEFEITLITPGTQEIGTGSALFFDFNAKVKSGTNLTKAIALQLSFTLRGTDINSTKIALTALPSVPATDIAVTISPNPKQTSLEAGPATPYKTTIKVKNNSKLFPIEEVLVKLVPTEGEENSGWFKFNQADATDPLAITIPTIEVGKSVDVVLLVDPIVAAKVGDALRGYILVQSYSMRASLQPDVEFAVLTEKKAGLVLDGVSQPFNISCNSTTQICTPIVKNLGEISLRNAGNVEIKDINIAIDLYNPGTSGNCYPGYIQKFTTTRNPPLFIPSLKPGIKETILVEINSPNLVNNDSATCVVKWTYIDPVSQPAKTEIGTDTIVMKTVLN